MAIKQSGKMAIKTTKSNLIVAAFLWLSALFIMLMSEEYMTDALFATALVFAVGGILVFRKRDLFFVRFTRSGSKKNLLWIPLFSLLFLIMLSWPGMFENPLWDVYLGLGMARRLYVYGFLFVLVPVGVMVSMCEILDKGRELVKNVAGAVISPGETSGYAAPFAVLACISFVFILASYPGLSEPDGWGLWDWVHNGVYDEWHTIGYLLYVKLCSMICDSLFTVEIANVLLYLVVNFWALRILSGLFKKKILWIYVLVSFLIFSPFLYLQGMNKDTVYNISVFGCCIGIYLILYAKKLKVSDVIFTGTFFLGAAIFRHAGLFVCEIALLAMFVFLIVKKRSDRVKITGIIMGTTAALYFLIVVVIGRWGLSANPNPPYVKYSVPMYMMGAMASDEDVILTDRQVEAYELFAPVETWQEAHTRYYADPVSREWGPVLSYPTRVPESVYGPAIIRTNFELLIKYPSKYLSDYFDMTSILWEITRPQDGMEVALVPSLLGTERYSSDTESVKNNGFSKVVREYSEFAANLPVYRSLVWRGGVALFCYLLLIVLVLKKKQGQLVFVISPYMLYYLSLFLSIPAQATRYVVGAVEILPFFAAICLARCMYDESI